MQINIVPYDRTTHKDGLISCYNADYDEMSKNIPHLQYKRGNETVDNLRQDMFEDDGTCIVAISNSVVVGAIVYFIGENEHTAMNSDCCFVDNYTVLPILSRDDQFRCFRLLFERVRIESGMRGCHFLEFNLFIDMIEASEWMAKMGFTSNDPVEPMYEGKNLPWRIWKHSVHNILGN